MLVNALVKVALCGEYYYCSHYGDMFGVVVTPLFKLFCFNGLSVLISCRSIRWSEPPRLKVGFEEHPF